MSFSIQGHPIGVTHPVYFIADIASNHSGSLNKAKELVHACAESGVDAVKMQNFSAETIVSDYGFRHLSGVQTHQSAWKQSVFESYKAAAIPLEWTHELKGLCDRLRLHYFTSPYSLELINAVSKEVCAFKIGSGDITWHEAIAAICRHGKPVLLATGASTMDEVEAAMAVAKDGHAPLLLMQCNTEYTAKVGDSRAQQLERFRHINLRVLETYSKRWPDVPVGLSDHTHGDLTVLGAVGMYGCSAVEKHFTLDNRLDGQDHAFSMTPTGWLKMVRETAALKTALEGVSSAEDRYRVTAARVKDPEALALAIGDGVKRIEANELGPAIVQRRSIRARTDLAVGRVLTRDDLVVLRPCPAGSLPPYRLPDIVGHTLLRALRAEEHITESDLG